MLSTLLEKGGRTLFLLFIEKSKMILGGGTFFRRKRGVRRKGTGDTLGFRFREKRVHFSASL